jgi:endonuclease YncB( thermonuclease family)
MSLPYLRVIKGRFHVKGYKPDGDSVRFIADNPALFSELYRGHKNATAIGDYQLRLEGIDAPETHYANEGQPHGDASRDRLLALLGFTGMSFGGQKILSSEPEHVRGTIASKGFDLHGRPISYVFLGDHPELQDGSDIRVSTELLGQAINAQLLKEGFAYPLFYTSMPEVHRAYLRIFAEQARAKKAGIWGIDSSRTFALVDRASVCLPSGTLIYPKFFRRCLDYLFGLRGGAFQGDLPSWLLANEDKNDLVVLDRRELPLSRLFQHNSQTITCETDVLDMLFIEK